MIVNDKAPIKESTSKMQMQRIKKHAGERRASEGLVAHVVNAEELELFKIVNEAFTLIVASQYLSILEL